MTETEATEGEHFVSESCAVEEEPFAWFAMSDITRPNALDPAHKMLERKGFDVFTPMERRTRKWRGQKLIEEVPVVHDLPFVHSTRALLDPIVEETPTLRYRFVKGGKYREPTVIRDTDIECFITAVKNLPVLRYYSADEIKEELVGRKVRVHGGPLDGKEVSLRKLRGTKKKHIIVEIPPKIIFSEVEFMDYDYLEFMEEKTQKCRKS